LNREEGEDLLATAHLPAAEGGVLAAMGDVGGKGLKAAMAVSLIEARVAARNRGDNRHQTASRHRSCISAAIIRLAWFGCRRTSATGQPIRKLPWSCL
jgi:hypothetical protein